MDRFRFGIFATHHHVQLNFIEIYEYQILCNKHTTKNVFFIYLMELSRIRYLNICNYRLGFMDASQRWTFICKIICGISGRLIKRNKCVEATLNQSRYELWNISDVLI